MTSDLVLERNRFIILFDLKALTPARGCEILALAAEGAPVEAYRGNCNNCQTNQTDRQETARFSSPDGVQSTGRRLTGFSQQAHSRLI
jgi:hypothetical protein